MLLRHVPLLQGRRTLSWLLKLRCSGGRSCDARVLLLLLLLLLLLGQELLMLEVLLLLRRHSLRVTRHTVRMHEAALGLG